MPNINELDLLTLIVALSAYVAAIRMVILGRLVSDPPPDADRKTAYKRFLFLLVFADAPLVISAVLLFLKIFWPSLFGGDAPTCFGPILVWLFFIGGSVLALHHAYSWLRSTLAWVKA